MTPTVTALYGSLNAIFNIALAGAVSRARNQHGISLGETKKGERSNPLSLAIRIHANNAEFVPLAIIVMLLAELCGGSSMVLHIAGGTLLTCRVFHMIGMPRPAPNFFRFVGAAGTSILIAGLAIWTILLRSRG